jgi:hypothetical protein
MTLNDMTIQTAFDKHRALYVNLVSDFKKAEIRAIQCFTNSRNSVVTIFKSNYSQANAIMGNALVDAQRVDERAGKSKVEIVAILTQCYYASSFLYNS